MATELRSVRVAEIGETTQVATMRFAAKREVSKIEVFGAIGRGRCCAAEAHRRRRTDRRRRSAAGQPAHGLD